MAHGEHAMDDRSRLEWVAKNRSRNTRTQPIGAQVAQLAQRLESNASRVEQVASSLAEIVDAEFGEYCRIEGIENSTLRVAVSDASVVAMLSRKWSRRLRQALPGNLKIQRIAFAYGSRGTRVG